jgi:hypothetical protein
LTENTGKRLGKSYEGDNFYIFTWNVLWLEDAGKDVRAMKVRRWQHKAVDREEWASVIKEDEVVLRGSKRQGVSK